MAETSENKSAGAAPGKAPEQGYKVAERREDGTVVLFLPDGERMFDATVKEGVEGIRKGSTVAITSDGEDESGSFKNAQVVRVL